jgi:hypothetical protein
MTNCPFHRPAQTIRSPKAREAFAAEPALLRNPQEILMDILRWRP